MVCPCLAVTSHHKETKQRECWKLRDSRLNSRLDSRVHGQPFILFSYKIKVVFLFKCKLVMRKRKEMSKRYARETLTTSLNFHLWTSSLKTVSLSVWSHVLRILMAPPCRLTFQNHTFTRLMDYNNGFSLSPFFLSLHSFLWIGSQFPQEKFLSYGRILTLYYYFLLMCILFSQDYYYIYFFWKFIIRNGLQDEMEICLASH